MKHAKPLNWKYAKPLNWTAINCIIEWTIAHNEADDNPTLLLKDAVKYDDICKQRMIRLGKAEAEMLALTGDDLPKQLIDFIARGKDCGCSQCWLSAKKNNGHPECEAKLNDYFVCRDKLVEYGNTLMFALVSHR